MTAMTIMIITSKAPPPAINASSNVESFDDEDEGAGVEDV
jgi:hypothetical protein